MTLRTSRRSVATVLALLFLVSARAEAAARPNIVLIITDDMGYSDLGCYGGEIETPNLDRLAGRGVRFTNYYVQNMCWPTRATPGNTASACAWPHTRTP